MLDLLIWLALFGLGWWLRGLWDELRPMSDEEMDEVVRRDDIRHATEQWEDHTMARMLRAPAERHHQVFNSQELAAGERAALRKRLKEEAAQRAARSTN